MMSQPRPVRQRALFLSDQLQIRLTQPDAEHFAPATPKPEFVLQGK
jgi:hypothetical protein